MHKIVGKKYKEEEKQEFDFVSYNSKGTLSIVMKDGTHYNFIKEELNKIRDFIKKHL